MFFSFLSTWTLSWSQSTRLIPFPNVNSRETFLYKGFLMVQVEVQVQVQDQVEVQVQVQLLILGLHLPERWELAWT